MDYDGGEGGGGATADEGFSYFGYGGFFGHGSVLGGLYECSNEIMRGCCVVVDCVPIECRPAERATTCLRFFVCRRWL